MTLALWLITLAERLVAHFSEKQQEFWPELFSMFVGRGSRSHDFNDAHVIMFLTSSIVTGVSVSKFSIVGGRDDWTGPPWTGPPPMDLRTASTFSLKKLSRSCTVGLSFDFIFLALSDPRMVLIERHSFCGLPACSCSRADQNVCSFCR